MHECISFCDNKGKTFKRQKGYPSGIKMQITENISFPSWCKAQLKLIENCWTSSLQSPIMKQ